MFGVHRNTTAVGSMHEHEHGVHQTEFCVFVFGEIVALDAGGGGGTGCDTGFRAIDILTGLESSCI